MRFEIGGLLDVSKKMIASACRLTTWFGPRQAGGKVSAFDPGARPAAVMSSRSLLVIILTGPITDASAGTRPRPDAGLPKMVRQLLHRTGCLIASQLAAQNLS
ncbi:hypothetical protein [Desulfobulbus sp.]|uniref:hypothetical protein n=1 Tax=Desulfobulbus sp. TaxID=895 RepID=UPI00286F05E3|nr:hypothetical protein [Desulfobulbus sp.]